MANQDEPDCLLRSDLDDEGDDSLTLGDSTLHQPLPSRQKLRRLALLTMTLGLLVIMFGGSLRAFTAVWWPPTVTVRTVAAASVFCLESGGWSPSGTELALLGYQETGPAGLQANATLLIYDETGHVLKRRIALIPLIQHVPYARNAEAISVGRVIWLTSGVAVTFYLKTATAMLPGIVVIASAKTFTLIGPAAPVRASVIWNLATKTATVLPIAHPTTPWAGSFSVTGQYAWTRDDQLVPVSSNTPLGASDPIGDPAQAATFQLWQPGAVITLGGGYEWDTEFAVASPDGRIVISPIVLGTSLSSPRDAGLAQVLHTIPLTSYSGDAGTYTQIAWKPNGSAIAALQPDTLAIYDCFSGRLLQRIAIPAQPPQFTGTLQFIQWSPDGKYLLLTNGDVVAV